MPDHTPSGFPYPINTDPVAGLPGTFRALAEGVEAEFASRRVTVAPLIADASGTPVQVPDGGMANIGAEHAVSVDTPTAALVFVTFVVATPYPSPAAKWAINVSGKLDGDANYYGPGWGYSGGGRPNVSVPLESNSAGPRTYAFATRLVPPDGRTITALQLQVHGLNAEFQIYVLDVSAVILGPAT